jgi:N-acetylmuramoyl-L-alanine amidase
VLSLSAACLLPAEAGAVTHRQQERTLIVVLDPGHGGSETGAADASQTLVEKNLTLQVAKGAQADLRSMGYTVYLTRTRDQAVNTPPRDLNHDGKIDSADEFTARTTFANRHHADVLVSIHFDGSPDTSMHGTHGYYCPARPFWRSSDRLATLLTSSISAAFTRAGFRSPNDGVQTDVADVVPQARPDYPWFLILGPSRKHFVTGSTMPGALIETLYLSSPLDDAALRHASIIAAAARGYANGIRAFFHGKTKVAVRG